MEMREPDARADGVPRARRCDGIPDARTRGRMKKIIARNARREKRVNRTRRTTATRRRCWTFGDREINPSLSIRARTNQESDPRVRRRRSTRERASVRRRRVNDARVFHPFVGDGTTREGFVALVPVASVYAATTVRVRAHSSVVSSG